MRKKRLYFFLGRKMQPRRTATPIGRNASITEKSYVSSAVELREMRKNGKRK
jgi:hypothetical protein